ncbi:MAG: thiamine pyrophosphate-dependent enzyme [Pseudomonadota bacterium]
MTSRRNITLHIPQPSARPGDQVDFSDIELPPAGDTPRPAIDASEAVLRELPFGMIRTLADDHDACGDWRPEASNGDFVAALKVMLLNRAFDDRMFTAQRQGKTSFFMKTTGEEALSAAPSLALRPDDMCFPTYRMVGWLLARGYPIRDLAHQIFNNACDPLQGRQLPILYSSKAHGFYSLSGNVGSRIGHAVGWAMAKAYRGDDSIAIGFIGEGTTAEGDYHEALTFASVYKAPVILCVTNNQWAISSFSGIAGGNETTFAAQALGYGIPGLRVDGNDTLAVWAAIEWAAKRARAGYGATLIEFFTYRAEGHSTSDDPTKYRPKDAAAAWPLGDPVDRLKDHLIKGGDWDEDRHAKAVEEAAATVKEAIKQAEGVGVLGASKPSVKEMFEHVFEEPDWRILEQRGEIGI